MRVFTRIAVVFLAVAVLSVPTLLSQPQQAGCPLTLVASNPASILPPVFVRKVFSVVEADAKVRDF